MSIYYEVYEHLIINDTEKYVEERDLTVGRLCSLGAYILNDCARIGNLQVIADGAEYHFSGKMMTQAYHEAITAAGKAGNLEIIWDYGYWSPAYMEDPGPSSMIEHLDEIIKEDPNALEGLFYSAYYNADGDSGAGFTVAYGKKNGMMYMGTIPYVAVESIPNGDWYTPDTAVVYDSYDTDIKDFSRIKAVCREMTKYSQNDSLNLSDDNFCFALNNLRIQNDAELKMFIQLYAQLIELTDGECSLIGELADISEPDVKMLRFDVEADGTYTLELANI